MKNLSLLLIAFSLNSFCIHLWAQEPGRHLEIIIDEPGIFAISGMNTNTVDQNSKGVVGQGFDGVVGVSNSSSGYGVEGLSDYVGVRGRSSLGTGVVGWHSHSASDKPGILGISDSEVLGATAILGEIRSSDPGGLSAAVRGVNNGVGNKGIGVFGSQAGSGWGIYGLTGDNGKGVVGQAGNGGWDFYAQGPGQDYGSSSSIRWKTDIQDIPNPLKMLTNLRGVYFDWDEEHGGRHDIGFIAEEVGQIIPEIVEYESNGKDAIAIDYSKVTPLLVEGIKAIYEVVQKQEQMIYELQELVKE